MLTAVLCRLWSAVDLIHPPGAFLSHHCFTSDKPMSALTDQDGQELPHWDGCEKGRTPASTARDFSPYPASCICVLEC